MRLFTTLSTAVLAAVLSTVTAYAAELVMVEQDGCHWCEMWDSEISHIYPKTEEGRRAPLRRVDLRDLPDDITFKTRPVFTPTVVLVDAGQELGRIEGYPGEEFFWFLILEMLDSHPDATVPQL